MIRGWLVAAAVVLCLAAGPGRAAGDVIVEGNRFYRDGRPWIAEGVSLVGRIAPPDRVTKKPSYAAARPGPAARQRTTAAATSHPRIIGHLRPRADRQATASGGPRPAAAAPHCSIRKLACRRNSQPPTRNSVPAMPST